MSDSEMRLGGSVFGIWLLVVGSATAVEIACQPVQRSSHEDSGECAKCHMPEYVATTVPRHVGEKPATCAVCHTMASWHPSHVDHPFWALTGAHEQARCFACHLNTPAIFRGTTKVCVGCHRADYDRAVFPGHRTFSLVCEECHTTAGWRPSTWKAEPVVPPLAIDPVDPTATFKGTTRPVPRLHPSALTPLLSPDVVSHPSKR